MTAPQVDIDQLRRQFPEEVTRFFDAIVQAKFASIDEQYNEANWKIASINEELDWIDEVIDNAAQQAAQEAKDDFIEEAWEEVVALLRPYIATELREWVFNEYDNSRLKFYVAESSIVESIAEKDEHTIYIGKKVVNTMTIYIDQTKTDPSAMVTYWDDAEGLEAWSEEFDEFFWAYPCLLKDWVEVCKLDPDDITKDIDWNSVDIVSWNDGDAMVCFPKRWLKIETDNNVITVSVSKVEKQWYNLFAFSRGTAVNDKFYYSIFEWWDDWTKLRSLSWKTPTVNQTIWAFRAKANANGSGYDLAAFYQYTYIVATAIIKYKSLNSQAFLWRWYVDKTSSWAPVATWATNTRWRDYWVTTAGTDANVNRVKYQWIEDIFGNIRDWIDWCQTDANRNILTATTDFWNAASYTNQWSSWFGSNSSWWVTKVQGTNWMWFIPKAFDWSSSTAFCDYGYVSASCVLMCGGDWGSAGSAGLFHLNMNDAASSAGSSVGSRLMFLWNGD